MRTLTLPKTWDKMHFSQKQYYLVDTHQAKNLCEAAKSITKMTNDRIRSALKKLREKDLWYLKETLTNA